ncbi:MAG: M12 family metallo-peptidase [Phycisphaerales bacterium]
MKRKSGRALTCCGVTAAMLTVCAAAFGQAREVVGDGMSFDGAWLSLPEFPAQVEAGEAWVRPNAYHAVFLDEAVMRQVLAGAPREGTPEAAHPVTVTIPKPDGTYARFAAVESPIYQPGFEVRCPDMKTYLGQGIDDPAASVRFDLTVHGLRAQVLSPNGSYWVDPYTKGEADYSVSYWKQDLTNQHEAEWACHFDGKSPTERAADGFSTRAAVTRREFTLAQACTGEYAAKFFSASDTEAVKKSKAQAAIVTSVNRVTGVYELEVGARFILVANNLDIVYVNGTTDPYTNNNGGTMLGENITNCNAVIGSANYDIGHVYSTGGGGVAYLAVVCTSNKAGGVTGLANPTGDAFYIDYVAHEMGHECGANHTFNSTSGSCNGNRASSAAYEPGSASTIMGYAGICGTMDLQAHSDAYFVHKSLDEINAHLSTRTCDTEVATGNTTPTANAGADYTIPISTPFMLTGSGSDPNGNTISYCWEERDLGAALNTFTDNGTSPILRSWTGTTDPVRMVPRLANLLANTTAKGEVLPTTSRTINMRLTVRDNVAGGGGTGVDDMKITTTTAAGPFTVTAPNTAVNWSGVQTVTWNVANTTAAPVSCANVMIELSTDGGNTWPNVLAASTPNDGSQSVTLPNISSTTARVRVRAVGNIFFDISNVNFTLSAASPPATPTNVVANPSTICDGSSSQLSATVGSGEVVDWYTGGCGTTFVGTGSPLAVAPHANTTYYARARRTSDSAVSTSCGTVTLTVNPLPTAPSSASSDRTGFCELDTGTITLTAVGGSGSVLKWFDASDNSLVGTGNGLVIASPVVTTNYLARWENSCGQSGAAAALVDVVEALADMNNDGFVNGDDYDVFADLFESGDLGADVNNDGFVNGDDFDVFAEAFESGC